MLPPILLLIFQALFFLSIVIVLILATTWIITNLQFRAHRRRLEAGKDEDHPTEPLMLPYAVPWVGSSLGFLREQASFWAGMRKTLGPNHDVCTLRMGPVKCYIISGAASIQAMFKMSRHLSSDKLERQIMTSVFGVPDSDLDIVLQPACDDTGKVAGMGKRNRIFDVEKLYQEFLLTPSAANALTGKFMEVFARVLEETCEIPRLPEQEDGEAEWTTIKLYEWLKGHMFTASTTALLGSKVLEMNPNLARDFWVFDENMLKLVYGLPRFLARRGHEARDRLVDGATRWLEDGESQGDVDSTEDWDPYFGSRFIREKEKMDRKMGLCARSRAGIKIGLLFGISSNAIPATGWILLHILTSPTNFLPRVLSELQTCTSSETPHQISLPTLFSPSSTPLLHSLYTETLRHYLALNLSRDVKFPCLIAGHRLEPGNMVMVPSWVMHRSTELWTDPGGDVFCGDRFLTHKDDDKEKVAFSTQAAANPPGKYFPWGGGAHVCPGRVFAKQEILAAVAEVLLGFEFEFEGWVGQGGKARGKEGGVDGRGFPGVRKESVGLGIMAMQWDARVRVRRRRRVRVV